ncbi:MAG TPA: GxxExxY protein [Thermoanaerobaculia bacterium]|jgi:GxxExxY protein|nr:GxxExxY protein [Thermoanaerobaculia bacterium]
MGSAPVSSALLTRRGSLGIVTINPTNHRDREITEGNRVTEEIIGAAIEVHRALGPGLLESAYEECLSRELTLRGVPFDRQLALPLDYKGVRLDCAFRLDLLVARRVIVEVKATSAINSLHEAQLLTYMKLTGCRLGLLINFNVPMLKNGIRRRIL